MTLVTIATRRLDTSFGNASDNTRDEECNNDKKQQLQQILLQLQRQQQQQQRQQDGHRKRTADKVRIPQ